MGKVLAAVVYRRVHQGSSVRCKAGSVAQVHFRYCQVLATMASDGIPRTRENSITKTSAHSTYIHNALHLLHSLPSIEMHAVHNACPCH